MEITPDPEELFEIIEPIGEGSYGTVYKARERATNRLVAVKKVALEADEIVDITKEIDIMKDLHSRNIVTYLGNYFKKGDLWIIMEFCGSGSVTNLLSLVRRGLTEQEIALIIKGLLQGLSYLHANKVIHRDIKAGNVLVTRDGVVKIADFGVSAKLNNTISRRKSMIGTPFWMPPEVIQQSSYDAKADIWSLGITAIEMAELRPPLSNLHPMLAILQIPKRPPPTLTHPEEYSKKFNDFLAQCMRRDPQDRATADELLYHPFLARTGNTALLLSLIDEAEQKSIEMAAERAADGESGGEPAVDGTFEGNTVLPQGAKLTFISPDSSGEGFTFSTAKSSHSPVAPPQIDGAGIPGTVVRGPGGSDTVRTGFGDFGDDSTILVRGGAKPSAAVEDEKPAFLRHIVKETTEKRDSVVEKMSYQPNLEYRIRSVQTQIDDLTKRKSQLEAAFAMQQEREGQK